MAMTDNDSINIGGKNYKLSDLSEGARIQLQNIAFCDEQIQQLSNEWAISDTARIGYTNALKRELKNKKTK